MKATALACVGAALACHCAGDAIAGTLGPGDREVVARRRRVSTKPRMVHPYDNDGTFIGNCSGHAQSCQAM